MSYVKQQVMKGIIRQSRRLAQAISLVLVFSFAPIISMAQSGNENNIKAMFILNFMKYIEWPSNHGVFKIGVAGDSDLYDALSMMTANRQESKKIKIERVTTESMGSYQIILLAPDECRYIDEWTKKYRDRGVLIISDDCKSNDAAINLLKINNKIRFEINLSSAKQGGVKISSRLADLAVTVFP